MKIPIFKQVVSRMNSGPVFLTISRGSEQIKIEVEWNKRFCFPNRKKVLTLFGNGVQSYNWCENSPSEVFVYDELEFINDRPVIYITRGHHFEIHPKESKKRYSNFDNLPCHDINYL